MRYVRAWEEARREQNALRYELEMDKLAKALDDCNARERNENRVNSELMRHLTQRIAVSAPTFLLFNLQRGVKQFQTARAILKGPSLKSSRTRYTRIYIYMYMRVYFLANKFKVPWNEIQDGDSSV